MAICARACNEITQELEYSPGPVKAESRSIGRAGGRGGHAIKSSERDLAQTRKLTRKRGNHHLGRARKRQVSKHDR